MNIAAVNYHFESKELLYRRVLEGFGESEQRWVQGTLDVVLDRALRISE